MHKFPKVFIFLDSYNKHVFQHNIINAGIIYRNYSRNSGYKDLKKIAYNCKKKKYKLFVSNNTKLYLKIKADGIYIPSFNKIGLNHLILGKRNIPVIGSAHNQKEISQKINQNCKIIFLSPLFKTLKKRKKIGIIKFNLLSIANKNNFYALGGINKNNITKLKSLKANGFAGISIFQKKTGLNKLGRFI